jgi:cell division protein ZapA
VSVKILGKEYQVACPRDEVDALTASARYLDEQMSSIRQSGKVFGLDRIAVMAALNIANQLLTSKRSVDSAERAADSRVKRLSERLERVLADHKQLNL